MKTLPFVPLGVGPWGLCPLSTGVRVQRVSQGYRRCPRTGRWVVAWSLYPSPYDIQTAERAEGVTGEAPQGGGDGDRAGLGAEVVDWVGWAGDPDRSELRVRDQPRAKRIGGGKKKKELVRRNPSDLKRKGSFPRLSRVGTDHHTHQLTAAGNSVFCITHFRKHVGNCFGAIGVLCDPMNFTLGTAHYVAPVRVRRKGGAVSPARALSIPSGSGGPRLPAHLEPLLLREKPGGLHLQSVRGRPPRQPVRRLASLSGGWRRKETKALWSPRPLGPTLSIGL